MKDLFVSDRLVYRAVDIDKDEDFFRAIRSDSIQHQLSNGSLAFPPKPDDAKADMKSAAEGCYLCVLFCIKPSTQSSSNNNEGYNVLPPVGVLYMRGGKNPKTSHHRSLVFGINILQEHQGKGYGSEAIQWGLGWAFSVAGMHRVEIGAFEYNPRAIQLYQKLGFKQEGRRRESFWHDGRFWDDFEFGMLHTEWRMMHQAKKEQ